MKAYLIACVLVLAGCASAPTGRSTQPYVKPGLIMLTADQAERRGVVIGVDGMGTHSTPAAPLSAAAVLKDPGIKAYTANRTVDAADPDVLHEEHVVYRRERLPAWRLDAPADQKIMVGPRITAGEQAAQPVTDKELTSFLNEQRRATAGQQKAIAALFQAVDALSRNQQEIARRITGDTATPPTNQPARPDDDPERPRVAAPTDTGGRGDG